MEITLLTLGPMFVVIGSISLGRFLVNGFIALEFFVGISLISLLITPIIFLNIDFVRPLIFLMLIFGYVRLIGQFQQSKKRPSFKFEALHRRLVQELLAILIPVVLFIKFESSRYIFENHDVMYLGWIQEIFSNDYSGTLRLPTLYPVPSGANHFYSSSLVLITGVFGGDMNLVIAQNLKYLLICVFFYLILRELKPKQIFGFISAALVPWLLFGREISYEFVISSTGYLFCLTLIIFTLMSKEKVKIEHVQILLLILTVSKAPIFFVPLMVFAYTHVKIERYRFTNANTLLALLVALNMCSWAVTPKSTGSGTGIPQILGLHPKIINGHLDLGLSAIKDSFNPWYLGNEYSLVNGIESHFLKVGIIFLLIIVKIYLPYFLFARKIIEPQSRGIMDFYMATGLGAWIFIRHVGNMSQVSHLYLLQSLVSFVVLTKLIDKWKHKTKILLTTVAFILVMKSGSIFIGTAALESKAKMLSSVKLEEVHRLSLGTGNELALAKQQVIYSLQGKKLDYQPGGDYRESQVFIFSRY